VVHRVANALVPVSLRRSHCVGDATRLRVDFGRATARREASVGLEAAPLDLVAEVLAEIHGDPMRLMEGEPLPSRA
jgi:hypothetical protein